MYTRHLGQSLAHNMYSLLMFISVHINTLLVRRKHEQKLYFYGGKKKYKNTGTAWPQVCSMPGGEQDVLGTNQSLHSYQSHSYDQHWCNQPPCGPHWGQRAPGWESITYCDGFIMQEMISMCDRTNGQRTPETQTLQNKHLCFIIYLSGTCGLILGHNNINQGQWSDTWKIINHHIIITWSKSAFLRKGKF